MNCFSCQYVICPIHNSENFLAKLHAFMNTNFRQAVFGKVLNFYLLYKYMCTKYVKSDHLRNFIVFTLHVKHNRDNYVSDFKK